MCACVHVVCVCACGMHVCVVCVYTCMFLGVLLMVLLLPLPDGGGHDLPSVLETQGEDEQWMGERS